MKEKMNTMKIEFDLDTKQVLGTVNSIDDQDTDANDSLKKDLFNSVKNSLQKISIDAEKEINELVLAGELDEALDRAKEAISNALLLDVGFYYSLKSLSQHLNDDRLKEIAIYLVAFSSRFKLLKDLEEDVDTCLRLKDESMDEVQEMSLYIEKSRILFEKGSFNASYIVLQEVLKKTKNNLILGCAYRNLARLATQKEDFDLYASKSIDNFIISGDKKSAIEVIFMLLQKAQGKNDVKALELIEKAIELQSSVSYIESDRTAALLQRKGTILIELGKLDDAKESILMACSLRRGIMGGEVNLHASLLKAEYITRLLGDDVNADILKAEYLALESTINDKEFLLAKAIADCLESGGRVKFNDEIVKVDNDTSPHIKFGYVMSKYFNENSDFGKRVELLDEALVYSNESKDYKLTSIVLNEMAKIYSENGYISNAIDVLYKSISINANDMSSFQNIIHFLLQEKRYDEACKLLKEKIDLVGCLPNLTYTYAKTLFNKKDYHNAYKYFKIVSKQEGVSIVEGDKKISGYMEECFELVEDLKLEPAYVSHINTPEVSLDAISLALDDFSKSVSNYSRMQYWVREDKNYKWASNPETIAKHHLLQFFSSRFGEELALVQEDRAGAGFIDLYLIAKNGLKIVVELKMCGNGYSSTYAISGTSQIIHYLTNKETSVGFLVVFDSRTRDFSKGLEAFKRFEKFSIYSKVVDVRSIVEK